MKTFEFYLIMFIIIEIFETIELLNVELQKKELCMNDSHDLVKAVTLKIQAMRDEKIFDSIWKESVENAKKLDLEEPKLPRQRSAPKKLESNPESKGHEFSCPRDFYRKIFYEIIDKTSSSLNDRFQNETIQLLKTFENFVTGFGEVDVKMITDFYNFSLDADGNKVESDTKDLDGKRLVLDRNIILDEIEKDTSFVCFKDKLKALKNKKVEKKIAKENKKLADSKTSDVERKKRRDEINKIVESKAGNDRLTLKDIVDYLREKPQLRIVLPELVKLIRLILLVPGSSCSNERSFSTLRRLKSWLRSTMLQQRLNDISICNIYKDLLDSIDIDKIMDLFILKCDLRKRTFALQEA